MANCGRFVDSARTYCVFNSPRGLLCVFTQRAFMRIAYYVLEIGLSEKLLILTDSVATKPPRVIVACSK